MSDDSDFQPGALRIMWRTVTVVAVIVAATASAIISAVIWEVKQDARIEAVEKWQSAKDKQTAEDARRELWRRDRERVAPPPGVPKS